MIALVGLGYGDGRSISLGGAEALMGARHVVLRTARCAAAERLTAMDIAYEACDDLYESCDTFDALGEAVTRRVLEHARKGGDVAFASPGGGGIGDGVLAAVMAAAKREGIPFACHPAASLAEAVSMEAGGAEEVTVAFAVDANRWYIDVRRPLAVLDLDKRVLASEVKLRLLDAYPDTARVFFRGQDGDAEWIDLPDLDRQEENAYGPEAALFAPAMKLMELERFDTRHLEEIMALLRGLNGCPWDKEQTHESLKQYLIEEAWEVLSAIDSGDPDRFCDELGDVLLQVAFHAQIAREHGAFTLDDVSTAVCRKMIARHPHIFGDGDAKTSEAVLANWEAIKKTEKGLTSRAQVMADVPSAFPGLMRAQKVQGKAEPKGIPQEETPPPLAEAVGKLLFAAARVARMSGVNAELALHEAVEKYISHIQDQDEEDPV